MKIGSKCLPVVARRWGMENDSNRQQNRYNPLSEQIYVCGFFKEKHKTGFIDLTAAASFLFSSFCCYFTERCYHSKF